MGKLEETFNLPEAIDDLEEKADQISEAFNNDEAETEVDRLLTEFKDNMSEADMTEIVNIRQYDSEMDEIFGKTIVEFEDLMTLGKDSEPKYAGEIFSAAAQMAKIALDARTNKTNARLKLLELSIRNKRNQLLEQKQNQSLGKDVIEGQGQVLSRDDLLAIIEKADKDDEDK